jgi:integrase
MPRIIERLSPAKIARTKVPAGRQHMMLADGGNLWLRITATGARYWVFRYRGQDGRSHEMGIGSLATLTISEARARARQHRQELLDRVDPLAARAAVRADRQAKEARRITFEACAALVIAAKESGWHDHRSTRQWTQSLRDYAFPAIGNLPVDQIDVGHVTKILTPIWNAKRETASRLRGRIESILDFAGVHGWRSGDNPAKWSGHLEHVLAGGKITVRHLAALPWRDVAAFMTELERQEGIAALALRFLIYTAARTDEVLGARWSEIDAPEATWLIPEGRMKAERAHRVALSQQALATLREAEKVKRGDYVFPGRRGALGQSSLRLVLERMGRRDLTVHGFRSCFRDWAGEVTAYPREVIEAALAHRIGDKTEAAYARGDLFLKRRRLMDDWARFCTQPAVHGEVIELRLHG